MIAPVSLPSTVQGPNGHPVRRALERLLLTRPLQAKLVVSQPADAHEQEADRAADEVMRMPEPIPGITGSSEVHMERKCTNCPEELNRAKFGEDEEETLQAKSAGEPMGDVSSTVEERIRGLEGHGRPLLDSTRSFMEPRFGADFSGVRIHTDPNAAALAREVSAQAFTVGPDIVFGAGRYEPDSAAGQHLLAHELSHVVQQGSANLVGGDASADRQAYSDNEEI
ncbi:MAG TPA: DUF4157 domain-containing protein [Polyangiaceae bacterium]